MIGMFRRLDMIYSVLMLSCCSLVPVRSDATVQLNPGCKEHDKCDDPLFPQSLVYFNMNDNDTDTNVLLWKGGVGGTPSMLMFQTDSNDTMQIEWDRLLNDTARIDCGYLSSNSSRHGFILFFSDLIYKSGKRVPLNNVITEWSVHVWPEKQAARLCGHHVDRSLNSTFMQVNVTLRADNMNAKHDWLLPRLAKTNQSILVDVDIMATHGDVIVGLQANFVPLWSTNCENCSQSIFTDTTQMMNDDHMPGIFKQHRLVLGPRVQVRWKPLAFTTVERLTTRWVATQNKIAAIEGPGILSSVTNDLRLLVCPPVWPASPVYSLRFTFNADELDKIDSSKEFQYLSWTIVGGYKFPASLKDSLSLHSKLMMALAFGLPMFFVLLNHAVYSSRIYETLPTRLCCSQADDSNYQPIDS